MSAIDMLRVAEAEVERLEAELAQTEAFRQLRLAKQVVELWRSATAPIQPLRFPTVTSDSSTGAPDKVTKAARVEAAAIDFFRKNKVRATSGELLEVMKKADIEMTGAEPGKALSAYLSNSRALNNIREYGGYGLAEWGNNRGPKTGA
jgi:hypothetical protein